MKKVLILATIALAVIGMAGSVFAATANSNVTINATVNTACTAINGNNLTIAIDPSAGTNANSVGGNTTVQCANAQAVTVTASSANNGGVPSGVSPLAGLLKAPGKNDIPYSFYFAPNLTGLGLGGAAYDLAIVTGTGNAGLGTGAVVVAADAAVAQVGAYTDQVTVTITY